MATRRARAFLRPAGLASSGLLKHRAVRGGRGTQTFDYANTWGGQAAAPSSGVRVISTREVQSKWITPV